MKSTDLRKASRTENSARPENKYPAIRIAIQSLALAFSIQTAAFSSTFQAFCEGNTSCNISINKDTIGFNGEIIPLDRIVGWGETKSSSKRDPGLCLLSLTACALTIFHDYQYFVKHATDSGEIQSSQFRFINDEPAKKLVREITALTNLASDQVNPQVIAWADARRAEIAKEKLIKKINCAPSLKPYGCSYAEYLKNDPRAKEWASANPSLVEKQMKQMRAIETIDLSNIKPD